MRGKKIEMSDVKIIGYLLRRLKQETGELTRAIKKGKDAESIKKEAVDIRNFAMMIF